MIRGSSAQHANATADSDVTLRRLRPRSPTHIRLFTPTPTCVPRPKNNGFEMGLTQNRLVTNDENRFLTVVGASSTPLRARDECYIIVFDTCCSLPHLAPTYTQMSPKVDYRMPYGKSGTMCCGCGLTVDVTQSPSCQSVRLGKSGLKVSRIILGCMSYGTPEWQEWILGEEEGIAQIKFAYVPAKFEVFRRLSQAQFTSSSYENGIQTFDTANVSGHGSQKNLPHIAL
jgi:hypothetical protein